MKRIYVVLLSVCMIFSLFSCVPNKKQSIKDITAIKDEYPVAITVTFQDDYQGTFEITDETLIKQVIDLLNLREYEFSKGAPAPGSNRVLDLKYASGETVRINTRMISVDKGHYSPSRRDDLDAILQKLGIESGTVHPR